MGLQVGQEENGYGKALKGHTLKIFLIKQEFLEGRLDRTDWEEQDFFHGWPGGPFII